MKGSASQQELTATHLIENGLDSLRSGAELLRPNAPDRDLRVALREVSSGIELILKGLLAKEHWSLIFDNPKHASLAAFRKGEFRSAGFEDCVQRLAEVTGVPIDEDRKKHLLRMRDKRNRLEHLGVLDNLYALRAVIGGALHAVAGLLQDGVERGLLDNKYASLHTELAVEFSEITDFVDARWKELNPKIKRDMGDPCPACSQRAGTVDDGLVCLFCGTRTSASDAADNYLEVVQGLSAYGTVKDGGTWPVYECPDCQQEGLAYLGDGEGYRCFSCDTRFKAKELTHCCECDRPFAADDDCQICSDCFAYKIEQD